MTYDPDIVRRKLTWITKKFGEASFRFAKTMPENPHFYTLRREWENDHHFNWAVRIIRELGEDQWYGGYWYRILKIKELGYFYWTMGWPIEETTLINRKVLEERERDQLQFEIEE